MPNKGTVSSLFTGNLRLVNRANSRSLEIESERAVQITTKTCRLTSSVCQSSFKACTPRLRSSKAFSVDVILSDLSIQIKRPVANS